MYSQRDEEQHILLACQGSERRKLLDVGAWDPKVFSNSRALIEQGWAATLIEPSPAPLRALVAAYADRADIDVISGAVAVEPYLMQLMVTDDAVTTVAGSPQAKTWATAGNYIGRMWTPALGLVQVIESFGPFDFVNIDAEGISVDLLKALLATEMFPRCICCEHDGRVIEAMQSARARNYHSVYESEENLVLSL